MAMTAPQSTEQEAPAVTNCGISDVTEGHIQLKIHTRVECNCAGKNMATAKKYTEEHLSRAENFTADRPGNDLSCISHVMDVRISQLE